MLTSHIDLGQLILAALITIVGWFVKREITGFTKRLDKHEEVIISMTSTLAKLAGEVGIIIKLGDSGLFMHKRAIERSDKGDI